MTEFNTTQIQKPRQPLYAALMSMALPGLGQLYNAQFNKAVWVFLLFSIASVPMFIIVALLLPATLTLPLIAITTALCIGIWLYAVIDGWRVANQLNPFYTKAWQTSGVYTLVFLVCTTIILPSIVLWVRKHQVEAFNTPSQSMEPSLLKGDYFFAQKSYNCPNCWHEVRRGDVAIFIYPDNRNRYYVKRIIALPGDKVVINGSTVTINGKRLNTDETPNVESFGEKSWHVQWSNSSSHQTYEVAVTPGHAFVLGDNRSRSNDSRVFGLVPLSDIVGKARQVWFSKSEGKVRWSRIGLMLNE